MNKITLSGLAGSGKSSVGKLIAERLNCKFISVGNFTREFAMNEFNMTINEFQEKCKSDPTLDSKIDEKFQKHCNTTRNLIIDYRLGFQFVENAFHVYLNVSDQVAFSRIEKAERTGEDISFEAMKQRNMNMKIRFNEKYSVDFTDEKYYHLVVDVDILTPEQIADIIIESYHNFINYEPKS